MVYYKPPNFQKFQLVKPEKICSHLATAEHAGQKNCNGKTIMLGKLKEKLGICLLLRMFIGEDWMVNLMIIYIKKIIAKALDFNIGHYQNIYGDVSSMSPNLLINKQIQPPIEILKLIMY